MAKGEINISGGRSRIDFETEFSTDTAEGVLLNFRKEIIKLLRDSLDKAKRHDSTDSLRQSIDGNVAITENRLSLEIELNDYYKFIDKGVDGTKISHGSEYKYKKNGKRIPLDAMLKMIASGGLKPKPKEVKEGDKKVKRVSKKVSTKPKKPENPLETLAWTLGAFIKRDGIKPTHFFTNVINDELKNRIAVEISKALKRDIELTFTVKK